VSRAPGIHPSTGTMPVLRPRRLSEDKPATSAITPLPDDEVTEPTMVTKIIFSRSGHGPQTVLLWKQKSTRQRRLHDSLLDLASVRSTRATAANHRQLISACRPDELDVANSNVTSEVTGQACPRHSACPACPGVPWGWPWSAPRGRPRKAGCAQCVPLIEQF
jgi:hypothetical protein